MTDFFKVIGKNRIFYIVWAAMTSVLSLLFLFCSGKQSALGCFLWCSFILVIYICRPKSLIHGLKIANEELTDKILCIVIAIAAVLICTVPMASSSPYWNGEIPGHRDQYENMADAILEGHLYIDCDECDGEIAKLNNPYDPVERSVSRVHYHWDHAYYNSHFYMYFGVVPVFLTFLPYRIITGNSLTTYHATQIFTGAAVIGIFMLMRMLAKRFFKNLPYAVYLFSAFSFSVMSVWYSITAPALYCTAITSAICLEIWSLYFFIKAVWVTESENRQIFYAFTGSLLGALVFGCRPTIALANVLVLPMLIVFIKQKKFSLKLFGKLIFSATPYLIVAVLLMAYNYARFDNPFEFGQAYQLTVADQTAYSNPFDNFNSVKVIGTMLNNFFGFRGFFDEFPFIKHSGAFGNFPILYISFAVFSFPVYKQLKKQKLRLFTATLFATPLLITFFQVIWSPFLMERYRMDIYFVMAILCFISIGFLYNCISAESKRIFSSFVMICSLITIISAFALFLVPNDGNLTSVYPEKLEAVEKVVLFWKYI